MKKILFLGLICGLISLLVTSAFADSYIRGYLERVDGNTLTVVDNKNSSTRIHITSKTIAVSRQSKIKIDPRKIVSGSKVNVTVRNGDAIVLVLEEEPK